MSKILYEPNTTVCVTQRHIISKYVNSFSRVSRSLTRCVMFEEEKLKPELVSIGEKYMLCSNEKFNQLLVRYLIAVENRKKKRL